MPLLYKSYDTEQLPDMINVPGTGITINRQLYLDNADIFKKGLIEKQPDIGPESIPEVKLFGPEALATFQLLEQTQQLFGPRLQQLLAQRKINKADIDAGRTTFSLPTHPITGNVTSMDDTSIGLLTAPGPELISPLRNNYMAVKAAKAQSLAPKIVSTVFDSEDAGHYNTTINGIFDVQRVRAGKLKGTKEGGKTDQLNGEDVGVMWMRYNGLGSQPFPLDEIALNGKPIDRTLFEAVFDISNGIQHVKKLDTEKAALEKIDGEEESAKNKYQEAIKKGPKAYIPKMVNAQEADFIDLLFNFIEKQNGIDNSYDDAHPAHAKVALVLETTPIFYELDAVASALHKRLVKTSFGRYDALANAISINSEHEGKVPPGPNAMGVNTAPASAQKQQMLDIAKAWGFLPMGGMDVAVGSTPSILENIKQQKISEGRQFNSCWISSYEHAQAADEGLKIGAGQRKEFSPLKLTQKQLEEGLNTIPKGELTTKELRGIIRKYIEFGEGYLQGTGCCSYLDSLAGPQWPTMEDFATAGEYTLKAPWMWNRYETLAVDPKGIAQKVSDLIPQYVTDEVTKATERATPQQGETKDSYYSRQARKKMGVPVQGEDGTLTATRNFYKENGDLFLQTMKGECPDIAKDDVVYPKFLELQGRSHFLVTPKYTQEEQQGSEQQLALLRKPTTVVRNAETQITTITSLVRNKNGTIKFPLQMEDTEQRIAARL